MAASPSSKSKTSRKANTPMTLQQRAVMPNLHQQSRETQRLGEIVKMPDGLSGMTCKTSVKPHDRSAMSV